MKYLFLLGLLGLLVLQAACGGLADPVPPPLVQPSALRAPGPASARRAPLGVRTIPDYRYVLQLPSKDPGATVFLGLLNLYRTGISPLDGNRNDMAPANSLYAIQAFKQCGWFLGLVLTAERLIHEPSEIGQVPHYLENGRRFYQDSLESNTYWIPQSLQC